jgi:NAD(P)-dependent dehydrogenase (short-subunit alcohol dehydrogenase family)
MNPDQPLCIVFGVGPAAGIGGATALRFAAAGFRVIACGRNEARLGEFQAQAAQQGFEIAVRTLDATQADAVRAVFEEAAAVPDFVLHNVGGNWPKATLDMSPDFIEGMWRTTCLSGMLVGGEALKRMQPVKRGTLVFTGASASLRGKPMFAAFAMAKAGLRAYAQACAREFGPQGIHVAHVAIDGLVRGERLQRLAPQFLDAKPADGALVPASVAEAFWQLHQQPANAWTQEMDLRPYSEPW